MLSHLQVHIKYQKKKKKKCNYADVILNFPKNNEFYLELTKIVNALNKRY